MQYGYTVYEEKRRCLGNHHFEVDSQRHKGKYQRFILARAWTRLIKDGTFDADGEDFEVGRRESEERWGDGEEEERSNQLSNGRRPALIGGLGG